MNRIEAIQNDQMLGFMPAGEAKQAVCDLGVFYQLVTDETSMVALPDEVFAAYGIERRNQARVAVEVQAQVDRQVQPVRNYRVDREQPMFDQNTPRPSGNGGGAVDPLTALLAIGLGGAGLVAHRRRRAHSPK